MNYDLIRDMVTPCLNPDYYTLNLSGIQVNVDIMQYIVNKMDEHYYNKIIVDFVIMGDPETIFDILLNKILEYDIMKKIVFKGSLEPYHLNFIESLLLSSKIQTYIFDSGRRYNQECICHSINKIRDAFITSSSIRNIEVSCCCDLNKTMMNDIIFNNWNINNIRLKPSVSQFEINQVRFRYILLSVFSRCLY